MFFKKPKKKVVSFADDSDCSIDDELPPAVIVKEQTPPLPPRTPPLPTRNPELPPRTPELPTRNPEKRFNFWPTQKQPNNNAIAKKSTFSWFTDAIYSIFKPKEKVADLESGALPELPIPDRTSSLPRSIRSMGSLSRKNSSSRKRDSGFTEAKKVSVIDKDLCSLCAGKTMIQSKICPSCKGSGLSYSEKSIGQSLYLKFKRISGTLFGWDPELPTAERPVDRVSMDRAISLKVRPPRSSLDPGPSSDWARNLDLKSVTRQKIASHRKREKGKPVIEVPVSNPHLRAIVKDVNAPSEVDFTDIVIRHAKR